MFGLTPDDFPEAWRAEAAHVFACSSFIAESFARDSQLVPDLLREGALVELRRAGGQLCWPQGAEPPTIETAEGEWQAWLRRWRRREMVRIAWRDLNGRAGIEETLEDLSAFADDAVNAAMRVAWQLTAQRYGMPQYADGAPMPMVVVGMGKLGGRELNFSSDIDLVFLFPGYGETVHAAPVSHDEFFVRLGQALLRLLATVTVDGFVFRVDMRLRPFGDSGPLACGFSAFEDYLLQHGRDWERYAWVKARPITATAAYAELYESAVRPFVYRRYLDFGVFESLREMKQLIEKQIARKDLVDHLKLGPGGIREIEFIVQAMQLIRGGQDRRLQGPRLFEILPQLARSKLLRPQVVKELDAAYRFLRTLENRLQMLADAQVHTLPTEPDAQVRLARAMGHTDWPPLLRDYRHHAAHVQRAFNALVFSPVGGDDEIVPASARSTTATHADVAQHASAFTVVLDEASTAAGLAAMLAESGVAQATELARLFVDFRDSGPIRRLDVTGRRRLELLLPQLFAAIESDDDILVMARRLLRVLEAIGGRSAYFALLNENPAARTRFVTVCRGGDFLVQQLAAHPLLLDELLDERALTEPPGRVELAADLEDRLARVDQHDPERLVEALAQFKRAAVFRVAIADLSGSLPLMRVSDRLTDIAELIVERAMQQAWQQMTEQFGVPSCRVTEESPPRTVEVCAVGYGKLGGIELGYGSDLDLVFLHDSEGAVQETFGERPLDNQIFFVRLAQRIVHILTVHSAAGRLYEVDVRLRPSGKGGMLITQIASFIEYQRSEAWTWEHQALLHARAVAGAPALRARFESTRVRILGEFVRREQLREEVSSMRERMRRELSKSRDGQFDLKQDRGGIADIEFLAQYWALREGDRYPAVVMFSDTIRQLETLASGDLVSQATVDVLTQAYRAYRRRNHHRSLREQSGLIARSEFAAERAAVARIWDETFTGTAASAV
ncbi:MAG: bifunctional [glutamate--ammonia ligase]-adenylyl-L-tyrosine phosphorylase/[glutamate--ammonia-ligase] adenylyltransferase [Gammaproteobacteria bacterium]|nr:bifunctional [glutamate--ammonia ligase]-adenylyl-L-tyrosine phosphorylase/[glutamate--ammonia-ligase] adenylyltransferase [Gammaproteobacteria bacterium]